MIFHDVDLIPSNDLLSYYTTTPSQPVHIARVWSRYNDNPEYFGGVVAFTTEQFRLINGFPNNFWGWGGEDDEMMKRIHTVSSSYSIIKYIVFCNAFMKYDAINVCSTLLYGITLFLS